MEDYRRWSTDPAYFAGNRFTMFCFLLSFNFKCLDDEDTNDYQPFNVPKSTENERFAKDKEEFKRKYTEQINQVLNQSSILTFCLMNLYFS